MSSVCLPENSIINCALCIITMSKPSNPIWKLNSVLGSVWWSYDACDVKRCIKAHIIGQIKTTNTSDSLTLYKCKEGLKSSKSKNQKHFSLKKQDKCTSSLREIFPCLMFNAIIQISMGGQFITQSITSVVPCPVNFVMVLLFGR